MPALCVPSPAVDYRRICKVTDADVMESPHAAKICGDHEVDLNRFGANFRELISECSRVHAHTVSRKIDEFEEHLGLLEGVVSPAVMPSRPQGTLRPLSDARPNQRREYECVRDKGHHFGCCTIASLPTPTACAQNRHTGSHGSHYRKEPPETEHEDRKKERDRYDCSLNCLRQPSDQVQPHCFSHRANAGVHQRRPIIAPAAVWCNAS